MEQTYRRSVKDYAFSRKKIKVAGTLFYDLQKSNCEKGSTHRKEKPKANSFFAKAEMGNYDLLETLTDSTLAILTPGDILLEVISPIDNAIIFHELS